MAPPDFTCYDLAPQIMYLKLTILYNELVLHTHLFQNNNAQLLSDTISQIHPLCRTEGVV